MVLRPLGVIKSKIEFNYACHDAHRSVICEQSINRCWIVYFFLGGQKLHISDSSILNI